MLVRAQSIARTVEARSGFLGNVTGHLKCAARIEIQPRSFDGCAFARTDNRAGTVGGNLPILDLNFANAAIAPSIVDQNSPRFGLRIAFDAGDGNDVINRVAIDVHADHTERVVSAQPFLSQSGGGEKHERDQCSPHARN